MPDTEEDWALEPRVSMYVRMPASLHERVKQAAKDVNMPVDAWVLRTLEGGAL